MEAQKLQKCKECEYSKVIKKTLEDEYKSKKATIILRTVTMTVSIMAAIINTILLFKK